MSILDMVSEKGHFNLEDLSGTGCGEIKAVLWAIQQSAESGEGYETFLAEIALDKAKELDRAIYRMVNDHCDFNRPGAVSAAPQKGISMNDKYRRVKQILKVIQGACRKLNKRSVKSKGKSMRF